MSPPSWLDPTHLWPSLCLGECFQALSSLTVFCGGWTHASCLSVPQHLAQCLAHSQLSVHVGYGVDGCVGGECLVEIRVNAMTPGGKLTRLPFSVEKGKKKLHGPGTSQVSK